MRGGHESIEPARDPGDVRTEETEPDAMNKHIALTPLSIAVADQRPIPGPHVLASRRPDRGGILAVDAGSGHALNVPVPPQIESLRDCRLAQQSLNPPLLERKNDRVQ